MPQSVQPVLSFLPKVAELVETVTPKDSHIFAATKVADGSELSGSDQVTTVIACLMFVAVLCITARCLYPVVFAPAPARASVPAATRGNTASTRGAAAASGVELGDRNEGGAREILASPPREESPLAPSEETEPKRPSKTDVPTVDSVLLPALFGPSDITESDAVVFELYDAGVGVAHNADHRSFPYSVGPFKLTPPSHMKPTDLLISESSSSGVKAWSLTISRHHAPAVKHLRVKGSDMSNDMSNKTICGHMEPFQEVNLGGAMRKQLGITTAKFFSWCYPAEVLTVDPGTGADDASKHRQDFDPDLAFVQTGGYIYCDKDMRQIRIMALQQDSHGYMVFGPPKQYVQHIQEGGGPHFHPITLPALKSFGATHFRWIMPNEEEQLCPRGGFVYLFQAGKLPAEMLGWESESSEVAVNSQKVGRYSRFSLRAVPSGS